MRQFIAPVVSNTVVGEGVYEMVFEWKADVAIPQPGQFCTLQVSQTTAPLLRRPFAFSGFEHSAGTASFIYKKRGPATEILSGKSPGETIDIIGPLGNSFTQCTLGKTDILVAGGTGFGPVFFWQRYLLEHNRSVRTIVGCKSGEQLPRCASADMRSAIVCTENGSAGFKGTTVDYLRSMPENLLKDAALFCCGPLPMLKACYDFALNLGVNCYVSLEQIMACGIGACMGCAVKIHGDNAFARVCTEGPIFNGKTILWT